MRDNIQYTNDLSTISSSSLDGGFFVGWPSPPSSKTHLRILQQSHAVWLATDGDQCVGFISAVSDGVLSAFIPLLEVLPDYQGRGIGKGLVLRMMESLADLYAVDIVCDASVAPFYDGLGFQRSVGMLRRNYANQSGRIA